MTESNQEKKNVGKTEGQPYDGQYWATVKNITLPDVVKPGERVVLLLETLEKDNELIGGYLIGIIRDEEPQDGLIPIPLDCLDLPERTQERIERTKRLLD